MGGLGFIAELEENPAQHDYSKASCDRTVRWLARCKTEMARLKHEGRAVNPDQLLFGINQGCTFADLRVEHMKQIAEMDLDGYAIGGLAVGEPTDVMYEMISQVEPHMPKDKIRYLMGVGTPGNIIEAVSRGVDLFDWLRRVPDLLPVRLQDLLHGGQSEVRERQQ